MTEVLVVYHSRAGHTKALAERVVEGARAAGRSASLLPVAEAEVRLGELAAARAIVFGSPTHMGGVSAELKLFMDRSVSLWAIQALRDKLAAGFTCSSSPSGDKLAALTQMAIFAAQHGMIWVSLGLPPGDRTGRPGGLNRLGGFLGAMAEAPFGRSDVPESDLLTAEALGRRVGELVARVAAPAPRTDAHPAAKDWVLPPEREGRVNLRRLAGRPERFEHHLTVVAKIGAAQLEIAAASEPLYFAHANISDEYAVALPTGDPVVDQFPLRTFISRGADDLVQYKHRVLDLVLHPYGALHWPGRLRPPYAPFLFAPGTRRTTYSLVYCASTQTSPADRPLFVSAGREGDVRRSGDVPVMLADLATEPSRTVAAIGDTRLELLVQPGEIAPVMGGYVVVLDAEGAYASGDLVRVAEGSTLALPGVKRALLFRSESRAPDPPPPSWVAAPVPPFPPYEDAPAGALPVSIGSLSFEALGDDVRIAGPEGATQAPRYWLARLLFRIGLHFGGLGRVETYGGFFVEDGAAGGAFAIGAGGVGRVELARSDAIAEIERLYRAVAPPGYVERLV